MIGFKQKIIGNVNFRTLHNRSYVQLLPSESIENYEESLTDIVRRDNLIFIRYEKNFDKTKNVKWWYVIKDQKESLSLLSSKVRNQIKNGLRNYYVIKLDRNAIIKEGYDVYDNAYSRYSVVENKLSFANFKKSIEDLPVNSEFIGVREKKTDKLVGFSENFCGIDCAVYVTMWLDPFHMKKYAGYALIHEMDKYYLNEKNYRYVSDGCRNLGHDTEIHQFLISKFGFRRAYSDMHLIYFPGVYILIQIMQIFSFIFNKSKSPLFYKLNLLLAQHKISNFGIKLK